MCMQCPVRKGRGVSRAKHKKKVRDQEDLPGNELACLEISKKKVSFRHKSRTVSMTI